MKTETKSKRGRKEKPYQQANGQYVNGLRRRPDGRWVVISTGKMFTEADETKAIERFYRLMGEKEPVNFAAQVLAYAMDLSPPASTVQSGAVAVIVQGTLTATGVQVTSF
jgi:hypothetical protein